MTKKFFGCKIRYGQTLKYDCERVKKEMNLNNKHPSREECYKLLSEYKTPKHVILHCSSVALTAETIGEALNEKGHELDIELIRGAAMLHDIARIEENHQEVGAKYVESLGYIEESKIIKVHMFYTADANKPIDETSLVCIADKMIKEDQYVGIDKRMEAIIQKFSYIEGASENIRAKLVENKVFVNLLENIIGKSIDALMEEKLEILKKKEMV